MGSGTRRTRSSPAAPCSCVPTATWRGARERRRRTRPWRSAMSSPRCSGHEGRVLIALAVLLAFADGAGSTAVTFPGTQRELPSPDSAYAIIWWGPDASDSDHSLLLRAPYTPKTWRVHRFAQTATVSWAPREYIFAVTERHGSDRATTVVLNVTTPRAVDVGAGPQRELGDRWTAAHHRYCEQMGWTERGELRLRLWGSGNGGAFDTQVIVPMHTIAW